MNDGKANESILKIARGVIEFQKNVYLEKQDLFKTLAKGQRPKILFITCSDSRVDSSLITQTDPGDMFVIQNAGNIIPPHGAPFEGIAASIEYAVSVLNVEHIIVCGHSNCGAMAALLNLDTLDALPSIKHWLSFAEATRTIVEAKSEGMSKEEQVACCIKTNIAVQLRHLKTIPSIAAKMDQGQISLHGWVYHIESGEIEVCNQADHSFAPLQEAYSMHEFSNRF